MKASRLSETLLSSKCNSFLRHAELALKKSKFYSSAELIDQTTIGSLNLGANEYLVGVFSGADVSIFLTNHGILLGSTTERPDRIDYDNISMIGVPFIKASGDLRILLNSGSTLDVHFSQRPEELYMLVRFLVRRCRVPLGIQKDGEWMGPGDPRLDFP